MLVNVEELGMEKSYEITFYYLDGRLENIKVKNEEEAKQKVWERVSKDPSCCANIIIAEYDPAKPHKRWVSMERYVHKMGPSVR